jgi:hypothetical protein
LKPLLAGWRRKFAVPHAVGQTFGESSGLFLAMNGDKFAKGGAKGGFGEKIDVDPIEQRFGEGLADIAKGEAARIGGGQLVKGAGKGREHNGRQSISNRRLKRS